MIVVVLILLGLCWGSFINAFVWRLREQSLPKSKQKHKGKDLSISRGRSMCVDCGHQLSAKDLVPILSWVSVKGKCRYCKKPISWQYPLVELVTAVLFVSSYIFWPNDISGIEIGVFSIWLTVIVGFMALIVYDLRWMLLPNKIVFPMYGLATAFVILSALDQQSISPILNSLYGILIGGGIFYVLFQVSKGAWIGGGDVKLGFLIGAIIGGPWAAFIMLFLASLLGTIVTVPLLALKKAKRGTRIPFGPFLIISAIIVQLFGQKIIDAYLAFLGF